MTLLIESLPHCDTRITARSAAAAPGVLAWRLNHHRDTGSRKTSSVAADAVAGSPPLIFSAPRMHARVRRCSMDGALAVRHGSSSLDDNNDTRQTHRVRQRRFSIAIGEKLPLSTINEHTSDDIATDQLPCQEHGKGPVHCHCSVDRPLEAAPTSQIRGSFFHETAACVSETHHCDAHDADDDVDWPNLVQHTAAAVSPPGAVAQRSCVHEGQLEAELSQVDRIQAIKTRADISDSMWSRQGRHFDHLCPEYGSNTLKPGPQQHVPGHQQYYDDVGLLQEHLSFFSSSTHTAASMAGTSHSPALHMQQQLAAEHTHAVSALNVIDSEVQQLLQMQEWLTTAQEIALPGSPAATACEAALVQHHIVFQQAVQARQLIQVAVNDAATALSDYSFSMGLVGAQVRPSAWPMAMLDRYQTCEGSCRHVFTADEPVSLADAESLLQHFGHYAII